MQMFAPWLTLRNRLPLIRTYDWLDWVSGAARWSPGAIDLASKVSVPRASLRASEESESYISASVEAMVVVRCVAKHRDYGKESLGSYTSDDCPATTPLAMPIPEAATPFQALIYGP
jgi:hypothetical protein